MSAYRHACPGCGRVCDVDYTPRWSWVNGAWEIDSGCWGCGANLIGLCITCQDSEAERLWAAILPPAEMALRRLFLAAYVDLSAAEREALLDLRLSPSGHEVRFGVPYESIKTLRAGGRGKPGEAERIRLALRLEVA